MPKLNYALIGPVLIAAFTFGCALLARSLFSLSTLEVVIVGALIFCGVMVLLNHAILTWTSRKISRKLAAIFGMEESLLKRIKALETDLGNESQIDELEKRLINLEQIEADRQNSAHADAREAENNLETDFSDGNIVRLPPQAGPAIKIPRKNSTAFKRKSAQTKQMFNEGQFTVRLQPIVNLVNKETLAVEAFVHFELDQQEMGIEEITPFLNQNERSALDHRAISAISRVVRKMERDGQPLPIHYKFAEPTFSNPMEWQKISNQLQADQKLTSTLIPVIDMAIFTKRTPSTDMKFLELREFGSKLCLANCQVGKMLTKLLSEKQFTHFKFQISDLLRYTAKEGERVADQIVPVFVKSNTTPFVDGVEKAHQAANMIDLDLTIAQGNFISLPRKIQLDSVDAVVAH